MDKQQKVDKICEWFEDVSSSEFFYCLLDFIQEKDLVSDELFDELKRIWEMGQ
jgi:hypothetical protein